MTKSARVGLFRNLQVFFETELCGLYRFDRAVIVAPEAAERPAGWAPQRRPPFGKYRELIAVQFGSYDITVASPNDHPPLGEIALMHPDGKETGPLDHVTWQRLGAFIRNREQGILHAA